MQSARLLSGDDPVTVTAPENRAPSQRYYLPPEGAEVSLQLAGISFEVPGKSDCAGPPDTQAGSAVQIIGDSATRIIDRDGASFFAALRRPDSEIFVLASSDVVDSNEPAPSGELPPDVYPRLLPWLLFI